MEIINLKDRRDLLDLSIQNELEYHNPSFVQDNDNVISFVVFEDEKVIGGIDYVVSLDTADVLFLYINKDKRGLGLSKTLLNKSLLSLKNGGIKEVFLEVRDSNIIARNLYKKTEFIEVGKRKSYYSNGEDAIIMKRELL